MALRPGENGTERRHLERGADGFDLTVGVGCSRDGRDDYYQLDSISKPEMALHTPGENGTESSKRRHLERGADGFDLAVGCSRDGRDDVREKEEEELMKLQADVMELREKVVESRKHVPVAFERRLEKSLAQMYSAVTSLDAYVKKSNDASGTEDLPPDKELLARRSDLLKRSSALKESATIIMQQLKASKDSLDKSIASWSQNLPNIGPPN